MIILQGPKKLAQERSVIIANEVSTEVALFSESYIDPWSAEIPPTSIRLLPIGGILNVSIMPRRRLGSITHPVKLIAAWVGFIDKDIFRREHIIGDEGVMIGQHERFHCTDPRAPCIMHHL